MKQRSDLPAWLRLAASLVGVIAAAALLWFVGPTLSLGGLQPFAGERERWIGVAALLVCALLVARARASRSARRNRRLLDGLGARDEALAPGQHEVALLDKRFREAIALLGRRRLGGSRSRLVAALMGRPYLHQLPWYVIVGAPGAGKTTALANSGLDFPLGASHGRSAVRGIGGTRNCDWWFTEQAVLIDTAGRYATQDSDREADRNAWLGFLDLLVRYRPRRPIDGVLLAVSAGDLLHPDAERRLAQARELRSRIDELGVRLGIRFPVYLLVTKVDLLAGFVEFFADFDKDERAQVWGATLPYDEAGRADLLARSGSELAALEKRLDECLLERLHAERERDRRAAIHAFPQQWRALREALLEFLGATFAPSLKATPLPLLRGIYFTSATQEGTPIDRALGGVARALGLARRVVAPLRPSGKSFFVTALLRDVVFAEAGVAGSNRRWQRRRVALEWLALGASAALAALAVGLAWRVSLDNAAQVRALALRLAALEPQVAAAKASDRADVAALVPVLDAMDSLARAPVDAGAASLLPRRLALGLDAGPRLHAAAQDAYRRLLGDALLPRIAARLEQRLRAGAEGRVEPIYEALKAYLMLFGGRHFDARALRAYLVADWEATLPPSVDAARRAALRRHLDHLLAAGEAGAPSHADSGLIAKARARVAAVALPQRIYQRLAQQDEGKPTLGIEALGGAAAQKLLVRASGEPRGVPALYARAAQASLRQRAGEVWRQLDAERGWVLDAAGGQATAALVTAPLLDEVERLRSADAASAWDAFLADLRFAPTPTLAARAELAQALSRPDSPLLQLLGAVARELPAEPRFDALRAFASGQPAPIDELRPLLGKLAAQTSALDDALRRKTPLPSTDATRELAAAAARAPLELRGLLADFANGSTRQLFAALREPLARQLAGEVGAPCQRAAEGRYPLLRTGHDEVSREDFANVFGPGGLFDAFFRRHLAPFVDTSARPWRWSAATGSTEPSEALLAFERAQGAREAFFAGDARDAFGLRVELRPLELDPGIGQFVLDIDGRSLRFARDARQAQTLQWPGPAHAGRVQLQLAPPGAAPSGAGYVFEGPWALFRLLDRVRVEPGASSDRVQLVFDVEGHRARFEARSAAPLNPLRLFEAEPLLCPRRL
jgi:type VI secretion system protein ImpL